MVKPLTITAVLFVTVAAAAFSQPVDPPRRDDGSVDYVALYNQSFGPRPANEDNAFVGIILAIDPDGWHPPHRTAMFEHFGLTEQDMIDSPLLYPDEQSLERFGDALTSGKPLREFPEVVAWLDAQQSALNHIAQALQRPRYYAPAVFAEDEQPILLAAMLPQLKYLRTAARCFYLRAIAALDRGDTREAWRNIQLMFDMARHAHHEPIDIGRMVAISIDMMAINALNELRDHPAADDALLQSIAQRLNHTPAERVAEWIDTAQRWIALDSIAWLTKGADVVWEFLLEREAPSLTPLFTKPYFIQSEAEARINRLYNRMAAAMRLDNPMKAIGQLDAIETGLDDMADRSAESLTTERLQAILKLSQAQRETQYTKLLTDLYLRWSAPRYSPYVLQLQSQMKWQAQRAAVAAVRYQREHGDWPASLDQLVPQYLDAVPIDVFTGDPLIYHVQEPGPVIYSAGEDGVDEHAGENSDEQILAVRINAPGPAAP